MSKKMTIAEIEKLINAPETKSIKILPDGSVEVFDKKDFEAEIDRLKAELSKLKAELKVTEELLTNRESVLAACPPCGAHGSDCVPHAVEWIEAQKRKAR